MKIDIVIPWVDNMDPAWQKKFIKYQDRKERYFGNKSVERFRDYNTLKYLFRSVEKYTPWVNHIFLITDNQRPAWLNDNNKVTVVDHREYLDLENLPCFNSNALELSIHKIPNLAEHFIYMNDDVLFNKNLLPEDFFINDRPKDIRVYRNFYPKEDFDNIVFNDVKLINRDVIKGNWPVSKHGLFSLKYRKQVRYNFMQICRKNISAYYDHHGVIPFTKKDFERAWKLWNKEFKATQAHKFRDISDVSVWVVRYLRLELGLFEPQDVKFYEFYTINDVARIKMELENAKHPAICINDIEVNNYDSKITEINKTLERKFPKKSEFEL